MRNFEENSPLPEALIFCCPPFSWQLEAGKHQIPFLLFSNFRSECPTVTLLYRRPVKNVTLTCDDKSMWHLVSRCVLLTKPKLLSHRFEVEKWYLYIPKIDTEFSGKFHLYSFTITSLEWNRNVRFHFFLQSSFQVSKSRGFSLTSG